MMAGSEDDIIIGGLEGENESCSHQDLVDCGGTGFECKGDGNGNGNVRDDDLGGCYVFVSGVGELSGLDVAENCHGDEEVDLHGEFVESGDVENGEVKVEDRVEFEPGEDLESRTGNGLEVGEREGMPIVSVGDGEMSDKSGKDGVESILELRKSDKLDNSVFEAAGSELQKVEAEIKEERLQGRIELKSVVGDLESRTGNGLDLGESEGRVNLSAVDGELLDKCVKDMEQNIVVSISELGESKQSDTIGLRASECELAKDEASIAEHELQDPTELKSVVEDLESRTRNGSELGQSKGTVILSAADGELLDKSVKDMEKNIVVSISELGEGKQSDTIGLRVAACELAKDEEELQDRTELDSVLGDLESRTKISVDSMSYELEKDQNTTRQMEDLGSDAELGGEIQEGVIVSVETGEFDKSVKAVEQVLVVSPADFREGNQSNTVALGADTCKLAESQAAILVDVGEGKSKEQTELNSVEESLKNEIKTTESVDCVSNDLEENRYKFKHMTDLNSEIDGGLQLGDEIDAVEDKGIICTAAADNFKVATDKDLDECVDGSQSVDKLDLTPSNAETFCSMDKEPIQSGENITACTDDYAAVEPEASRGVLVQGIGTLNSTEFNSDINQAKIFGSVLASIDASTVSDQGPVDVDYDVGLVQGYEAERVAHDIDGTMTTETATRSATDQSKISQINPGEQISGCTKFPELNGNPDDAHSDCVAPQVQSDEIMLSDCNGATISKPEVRNPELVTKHIDTEDVERGDLFVTDGTKTETETEVGNDPTSCSPNDVKSEMKIEFGTIDSTEVFTKYQGRNLLSISEALNGDIECNQKQAILTTNSVESESCAGMSFKPEVQNHSAINHPDMPGKDATVATCSIDDSVYESSLGNVAKAKPFQFLAKFPRIDDNRLRDQIRDAQLLVEEKTVLRNNIGREIDIKRATLQSLCDEFEATRSDERAARRLVKLKRQEIDSVQDKINRVKNSISVMDITNRIAHMEHMMEHETRPLKEEMQLLREINLMKKLRGQISSNVCSAEEVTQALSQIESTEMQLKTLKKELGDLKGRVSKAEAAVILLGKEYNDESKKLRELQTRFRAANGIRQDAYKDLLGLKREFHEKSKHYWIYKDEAKAANDYALNGDKEALYHLCTKQVDTFMDLWNKNDDFREDYVRCNMKSTLRRFKTLDGRSLGPDEEAHVFPVYVGERESQQLYNPSRTTNPSSPTILKQENTVQPVEREPVDGKYLVVAEPKSRMLKSTTSVNPIPESGLHIGSGQLEADDTKEEEKQQTEEELELAMKDEMLRKQEIAAKLKEQLRQEEKVKAQEALERKKRNADKAQMRAVLRAQKEAEQKEKEREKRLRKKEKKNTDGENGLELQTDQIKEESKDSPQTKPIKTSHFNKYSKAKATIPPALRNRGKSRLKQFMWWFLGGLIVLFIFLVGNGGAFKNLRLRKDDSFLGNHGSAQPIWQS